MAYGLKYFSRYKDIHGVIKEIRFLKVDYVGAVKEWHNSYGACDIDQGSSDAFFDKPIVTTQARISLYLEEQYDLSEFVYDRKTFFCQRVIPALGATPEKIEWTGWLEPWDAARPYKKPPWTVSLTASCGLAHLSRKKYVNPDNVFKKTGLKLIQECLEIIGSELGLRVSTHMYENSWIGDPEFGLASFEINTARFYDQNGEAMYCDEIVNDILDHFTAELTQWDNRWVVRSIVDHATGFEPSYQELTFQDGPAVPASPWPGTYIINDTDAFSVDGGEIRILAPITKYRIEVDMGPQMPYFQNGNMVLWTDSGLVGWDFTQMPKGNPGWEQYHLGGDPEAASVLKINGIAPGPYQKKRKKKLVNILGAIAIGAVGANLKNKYYDVEPTEWIESPGGKISKGDKSLKISFDYETAAFSGDVIIAIRMPSVRPPYTVWWFWPGMANSGILDEFKFIIVPAVDREGLIYKSTINVAGNPNYPDGFLINWTYVVTGVPAGQVRRIGGVSGVPVENGDLIVSKITNPGGTQAAVGANWDVINIRNNTKKGTFEVDINLEKINLISDADPDRSLPIPEVFVRFYKISHHEGKTGDWYKIYNLKGELEGFVATDDASRYATTLERGSKTDEEAETIHHITGDYNPWFSGSLTLPGSDENTKSWRRRPDLNESLSIYRASMLDRLCMTSRPLDILQGEITLMPGAQFLSYLHTLVLADRGNMRMRIVRYSYNDYSRKAKVTAIQAKYEEIPVEELRQDSYIPGSRLLNSVPGQGDGVYPTKQDSSNGRLSADEVSPTVEQVADAVGSAGRLGAIFDITEHLQYVEKVKSEASLYLASFIVPTFTELNEDQEDEDKFDLNSLVWTLTDKPDWITDITIVFLTIKAAAIAPKPGIYYIYYDVADPESGVVFEVKIPIRVLEAPVVKVTLKNMISGNDVGVLPGSFLLPDKWELKISIQKSHNNVRIKVSGPEGILVNDYIYSPGGESDSTEYFAFQNTDGIVTEHGLFKLDLGVDSNMLEVYNRLFPFTLYTPEFLSKFAFEFWNADKIADISIQDDSKFKNPGWYDIKGIVTDTGHDKATLTLSDLDGVEIKKTVVTHVTPQTDVDYFLYGSPQVNQTAGKRRINIKLHLAGDLVMERQNDFEILAKPPVPEGGLYYGTMIPYTANFVEVMQLPVAGAEMDLPINGINFMAKIRGEFDYVSWQNFRLEGESFVEFTGFNVTRKPNVIDFKEVQTEADILAFWEASSRDLGVHEAPSKFRTKFIVRLGGEAGQIVQIIQGDLGFRIPLDPEDLSGLRFLNIDHLTGEEELIDSNIPKIGRSFAIPKYPKFWTASFKKLKSGLEFDQVVFKLKKDGVILHLFVTDAIVDFHTVIPKYLGNKATELLTDHEAFVFGFFSVDHRTLKNPSNVDVNIDLPGTYVLTAEAYRLGALMEAQEAEITLVDEEDIEETPEADCCGVTEWFYVAW